jgi:hypothetical protein
VPSSSSILVLGVANTRRERMRKPRSVASAITAHRLVALRPVGLLEGGYVELNPNPKITGR